MENGLTEEKISRMDADDGSFSARETLALTYAEKLAVDHHNMGDDFFAELHTAFNDAEILELGMMIGQYIGFGRLLKVLDLEPKTCAVE